MRNYCQQLPLKVGCYFCRVYRRVGENAVFCVIGCLQRGVKFATADRVRVRDYGRFEQILQLASCGSQKESGMILKKYHFQTKFVGLVNQE